MVDQKRFAPLDGLRGLAAIAVTIYHVSEHRIFSSAWIAVDLFFVLSGFVICHSYEKRLDHGLRFLDFWRMRMRRLAPLYYIGLALGVISALIRGTPDSGTSIFSQFLKAALFLPEIDSIESVTQGGQVTAFPLNGPAWSLFFELLANIAFFLVGAKWLDKLPKCIFFIALGGYCTLIACTQQYNAGWALGNLWLGLIRVMLLFYLGTAIYRGNLQFLAPPDFWSWCIIGLFFASMLLYSKNLALFASAFIAPCVIAVTKDLQLPDSVEKLGNSLGELSYPLYITHFPIYKALSSGDFMANQHILVRTLLTTAICMMLASLFGKIDQAIRKRLR